MAYQPGIPTGLVPLNQDYLNIQNNFNDINNQYNVDHVPLTSTSGTPPNGYHEAIHSVPVSTTTTNPPNNQPINGYTATAGYGQFITAQINDGINTDEAFFYLSGGNRLMQLTRNFTPITTANGATFLPGGLILQYGTTATTGVLTPVTFAIPFPTACYAISALRNQTTDTVLGYQSLTQTGFSLYTNGSSSSGVNFTWMAIGI